MLLNYPMNLNRKRKTKDPCAICFLHKALCICEFIPSIALQTKVWLLVHAKELKRTTNTGRLAIQALANSEMKIRGLKDDAVDLSLAIDGSHHPLLLFPAVNAIELNEKVIQAIAKPILLVVPDGNWRQASKVYNRHTEFKNVQCVFINSKNSSTQFLRKESTENGMATLQAMAYALGVIEGAEVQDQLLSLYSLKLNQTLIGRGQKSQVNSV